MANQDGVVEIVLNLSKKKFWGKLTICFKNGEVYHLEKVESIRPRKDIRGNAEVEDGQ